MPWPGGRYCAAGSLDCVDDEMASSAHFVWPRETLWLGERFPLKAGLVTSLGFGHVLGLIALVHRQAFLAAPYSEQRASYVTRAATRVLAGQRRLASAIAGGRPLYESRATAASVLTRRRSGRRPRCCSTLRRGWANTASTRGNVRAKLRSFPPGRPNRCWPCPLCCDRASSAATSLLVFLPCNPTQSKTAAPAPAKTSRVAVLLLGVASVLIRSTDRVG